MNEGSDGADVTSGDSPFQTRAATTGKARSPTVVRRVGGIYNHGVSVNQQTHCVCLFDKQAYTLSLPTYPQTDTTENIPSRYAIATRVVRIH